MRELGIIPVFPPREDVQVGDVYIAPISPDQEWNAFKRKEFLPLGLWVATLDVNQDVSNFYSKRPSFPLTPTNTVDYMNQLTNNPFAGLPQAQDTNRNIFIGGDTSRLRMVGFPMFMSATFNKGDLAAVVPVEAVNLAFAGGFSSSRSVTVSIPVAESYGLPAAAILNTNRLLRNGTPMDSLVGGLNKQQLGRLVYTNQAITVVNSITTPTTVTNLTKSNSGTNLVAVVKTNTTTTFTTNYFAVLRVITEVYYARALDISVADQTTRGFGLAGRPLATDAISSAAKAAGDAAAAASNSVSTASSTNPPVYIMTGVTNMNANAIERADELNRSLSDALSQTVPGGSVKFVAAGDRGVSLRRTYERPIAIGYRYASVLMPIDYPSAVGPGWSPTSVGEAMLSAETFNNTNANTNTPPVDSPGNNNDVNKPGKLEGK